MASSSRSRSTPPGTQLPPHAPNTAFRALRGLLSPGEFAAAVRRSAREIGEQVSCDARYIGRVESGEIRCPNYAYERVFLHMFPGYSLTDMGFAPRETVRGRAARSRGAHAKSEAPHQTSMRCGDPVLPRGLQEPEEPAPAARAVRPLVPGGAGHLERYRPPTTVRSRPLGPAAPPAPYTPDPPDSPNSPDSPTVPSAAPADTASDPGGLADLTELAGLAAAAGLVQLTELTEPPDRPDSRGPAGTLRCPEHHEESDVLRRAFMTAGPATAATASFGGAFAAAAPRASARSRGRSAGDAEARAVEHAVRHIRLLDDRQGGGGLYRRATAALQAAYELLDGGARRRSVAERLHTGAGELAISVGWLAHDSGRFQDARSHYAEALATARVAGDTALEAHAFCNTSFLARDAGRPREAVRAAQAGQQAARHLGSDHLLALLALREAGGWAGLGDHTGCRQALARAHRLFGRGPRDTDPEWMSFFGEAELEGLEAQCWSALEDWDRAARHAGRAVRLQDPHFTRNRALFTAELAGDLAARGRADEAAAAGSRALDFLGPVQSPRVRSMLDTTAARLHRHRREPVVAGFLARHAANS